MASPPPQAKPYDNGITYATLEDLTIVNKNILGVHKKLNKIMRMLEEKNECEEIRSDTTYGGRKVPSTTRFYAEPPVQEPAPVEESTKSPAPAAAPTSRKAEGQKKLREYKFKSFPAPNDFKVRFCCAHTHPDCPYIKSIKGLEEKMRDKKEKVKVERRHLESEGITCKYKDCCHHVFDFNLKSTSTFTVNAESMRKVQEEVYPGFRLDYGSCVSADHISVQNKHGVRTHMLAYHGDDCSDKIAVKK